MVTRCCVQRYLSVDVSKHVCLLLFDVSIEATFIVVHLIAAKDWHQVDVITGQDNVADDVNNQGGERGPGGRLAPTQRRWHL